MAWCGGLVARFIEFFPPTHPIRELRRLFEPLFVGVVACAVSVLAISAAFAVCGALASIA